MKCSNCGHEQPSTFIVPNAGAGQPVLANAVGTVAIPVNGAMQHTYNAAAATQACAPQFTGTCFIIPCN